MPQPIPASLEQQTIDLYAAVGMALTAWSGVEWQLSRLFALCITPDRYDPVLSVSVAERGFWAIASFDAKRQLGSDSIYPLQRSRAMCGRLGENSTLTPIYENEIPWVRPVGRLLMPILCSVA